MTVLPFNPQFIVRYLINNLLCVLRMLSDTYRLSLPVGSLVIPTQSTHQTNHTRGVAAESGKRRLTDEIRALYKAGQAYSNEIQKYFRIDREMCIQLAVQVTVT
jgi:hypothetical protein